MNNRRTLKTIGKKLHAERKDAGLTMAQLAADSGVSKGNLSKIEHGSDFQISTLYKLCKALGTRPRYVLPDFKLSNESPF